jgi:NADH-quinone oxidoreductase subunit D
MQVPEKGMYLRTILAEIDRINYTLYWLAILGIFMGHSTMFMWTTADRELFVELADMASGNRITHSYIVPGGVRNDLPQGFADKAFKFLDYFETKRLPEYNKIFYDNPLFRQRSEGVGVLSRQDAINLGVTGSVLRASGVTFDVRKNEPYGIYSDLKFEVPIAKTGDSFARSILPVLDIHQSLNIIRQCLSSMPQSGQVRIRKGIAWTLRCKRRHTQTLQAQNERAFCQEPLGAAIPLERCSAGRPSNNLLEPQHLAS